MGRNVFANGREISAKADNNKSIAAMPDVCLSPPSPPAGPIPIPYPNFSKAADTTDGTRTVKIGGKEVGQKNKSSYKTSKGDEAATRNFGMGVITRTIQGRTKHIAWSMDVKVEGENVIRHLDLTTHNHASDPMNSGSTAVDEGSQAPLPPTGKDCEELKEENARDRNDLSAKDTKAARRCGEAGTNVNYNLDGGPDDVTAAAAAHSWKDAAIASPKHLEGMPFSDRKGLRTNPVDNRSNVDCSEGSSFHYARPADQTSGHAEARIIETIFANSGGGVVNARLTIAIDWLSKNSCSPCPSCHALMCAASRCGLEISICDKDNKPQRLTNSDCEDNLDMQDASARRKMARANTILKRKLDRTPFAGV